MRTYECLLLEASNCTLTLFVPTLALAQTSHPVAHNPPPTKNTPLGLLTSFYSYFHSHPVIESWPKRFEDFRNQVYF